MATRTVLYALLPFALAACTGDHGDPGASRSGMETADDAAGPAAGPEPATVATPTDASPDAMGDSPPSATAANGDRNALMAVAEVDRHEIAAAGDALAKNVEGEVRRYAETLREDHSRNLEATQRLMGGAPGAMDPGMGTSGTPAQGQGSQGMPGDMDHGADDPALAAMRRKHDAERARLASLEGEAFATAWVDAMAKGHEEALARLDADLIPAAADAAVMQHLRDTRAAISRHLEMAQALQPSGAASR